MRTTTRRRLAVLLTLGVSLAACGGRETTKLSLAGRTNLAELADAAMSARALPVRYVAGPGLPELGGPAMSWRIDASPSVRIEALAAALGLTPDPDRPSTKLRLEGATGAVLELAGDATASFTYTANAPAVATGAMDPGDQNPPAAGQGAGSAASPGCDPASSCAQDPIRDATTDAARERRYAEVERLVRSMAGRLSIPVSRVEITGDRTMTYAVVFPELDGLESPLTWSLTYGADDELLWASGHLGTPVEAGELDRVMAGDSLVRIADWRYAPAFASSGVVMGTVSSTAVASPAEPCVPETGCAVDTSPAETQAPGSLDPGTPPPPHALCGDTPDQRDPDGNTAAVVPCASAVPAGDPTQDTGTPPPPEEPGEFVVEVTNAAPALGLFTDTDGVAWLLPAYTLGNDDGTIATILAVHDRELDLPVLEDQPAPAPRPLPPVPAPGPPVAIDPTTPVMDPASQFVKLDEQDALALAAKLGLQVRIVARDGEEFAVTADYRTDRVNLRIESGVVVEATIG